MLGTREKLPNDLVWLFSQQSELPLVTLQLIIKAGTLEDPPGKEGLANLTASLLLNGTKSRSAAKIAEELDFMGASLSSSGGDDFATVSLTVLKKDLGPALELLKDILMNPTFPARRCSGKRASSRRPWPATKMSPWWWPPGPLSRIFMAPFLTAIRSWALPRGLPPLPASDLVDFHRQYYRPNNAVLSVVGDLTPDEARQWVTKTFGAWAAAPLPAVKLPAHSPPDPTPRGGDRQRYQPGQHHPGQPGDRP